MHSVLIIYFVYSRPIWSNDWVEYYNDFFILNISDAFLILFRSSKLHGPVIYIYTLSFIAIVNLWQWLHDYIFSGECNINLFLHDTNIGIPSYLAWKGGYKLKWELWNL